MDGDCETTPLDVRFLAAAKNWNRLRVFVEVQNEWSVSTGDNSWDREWGGP